MLTVLSGISYQPDFIPGVQAENLKNCLWKALPWQQQEIKLFGRPVMQPRLTAWCSDPGIYYQYSGLVLGPCSWHPALHSLRKQLNEAFETRFNSVLINAYRNGDDSMGWHSDNEPELGTQPVIASVSLGAQRNFRIRPSTRSEAFNPVSLPLAHGSLLIMAGDSQQMTQHCVPKTRKATGLRINLTFRDVRLPVGSNS